MSVIPPCHWEAQIRLRHLGRHDEHGQSHGVPRHGGSRAGASGDVCARQGGLPETLAKQWLAARLDRGLYESSSGAVTEDLSLLAALAFRHAMRAATTMRLDMHGRFRAADVALVAFGAPTAPRTPGHADSLGLARGERHGPRQRIVPLRCNGAAHQIEEIGSE